jgi:hypothetical protein
MGDVKDILGVPRDGGLPAAPKSKKDTPKLVKPKGMSRQAAPLARHRSHMGRKSKAASGL